MSIEDFRKSRITELLFFTKDIRITLVVNAERYIKT
jgi:hypothetical protein